MLSQNTAGPERAEVRRNVTDEPSGGEPPEDDKPPDDDKLPDDDEPSAEKPTADKPIGGSVASTSA
jgi:hypothetical protein